MVNGWQNILIAASTTYGVSKRVIKSIYRHFISSKTSVKKVIKGDCKTEVNLFRIDELNISFGEGKALTHSGKLFEEGEGDFGFMNEDSIGLLIPELSEALANKNEIALIKKVLNHDDVRIYVLSRSVIRMESMDDKDREKQYYTDLLKKFNGRGKKIYNLLRGGYFDEMITDLKWDIVVCDAQTTAVREKFQARFDKIVAHCDHAIFICSDHTIDVLTDNIKKELEKNGGYVNIHFRQNYRRIAEESVERIEMIYRESIKITRYRDGSILDRPAYIWTINKI